MNFNELHLFEPIHGSNWYAVESRKPSSNAQYGGSIVFEYHPNPEDDAEFTIRLPRATIAMCKSNTQLLSILDRHLKLHLGENHDTTAHHVGDRDEVVRHQHDR